MTASVPWPGSILTTRQLNRALLARQSLLQRSDGGVASMLEHLAGMQSQVPKDPFIGLWTRLDGFTTRDLDQLMLDREAVRHTVMRGTIHLTTARDLFALRPVMQATLVRTASGNAQIAPHIDTLDVEAVMRAGREALTETPMTARQLGELLAERFPEAPPNALASIVRFFVPVVQVTPRGTWTGSQQATMTTVEAWLGKPVEPHAEPDELVERYLRAFGPATVADVQAWSGLAGLRPVLERLRSDFVTYRDERNRELFDVPGAPFPDPGTTVPVRFLPGFDNVLLSHADRTRIVDDALRKLLWKSNGLVDPTFLVDGRVAGRWKASRSKDEASLTITPFAPLDRVTRDELDDEGKRLLAFLEGDAAQRMVTFNDQAG